MKHIKTLNKPKFKESVKKGGCGECQATCQSYQKTSNGLPHQKCEKEQSDT